MGLGRGRWNYFIQHLIHCRRERPRGLFYRFCFHLLIYSTTRGSSNGGLRGVGEVGRGVKGSISFSTKCGRRRGGVEVLLILIFTSLPSRGQTLTGCSYTSHFLFSHAN